MTEQQIAHAAATVTTPTDREIHIERVFDAPRDRVFATFTDPDLIPEWWGPRGGTTVVDQMDVRPGGAWRYVIRTPDGDETAFRGTYREVSAPERVVQTFEWEGLPGHVSFETAEFEDLGDRIRRRPGEHRHGKCAKRRHEADEAAAAVGHAREILRGGP